MLKWSGKILNVIFDFNLELERGKEPLDEPQSFLSQAKSFLSKNPPFVEIPQGFKLISDEEYREKLGYKKNAKSPLLKAERTKLAFDLVVENRKFEIELYWRRATYFWAFIASAFVAYAALARSDNFCELPTFIVICIGFILSSAWYYTNLGSKTWQRHWEKHLDLLEDHFTGPLYKTVFETRTYSVSKINVIVSFLFRLAWIGLAFDYLQRAKRLNFNLNTSLIDWPIIICIFVTFMSWLSMNFGYGRGRFRERDVKIYERL